ncbi:ATP-binding protein [Pontibacter sp. G13]|uniref:ATP-binding protein n=1 Tax=Pontibacter sp. G13 TaxID=3074898 RepID=UPI00288A59C1|nr:ATP-binding protein [Pontibacter sp. G13]WNJ18502.1 ATP-binding protein [Pontibacter sp. G13]
MTLKQVNRILAGFCGILFWGLSSIQAQPINVDSLKDQVAILYDQGSLPEILDIYFTLGQYYYDDQEYEEARTWYFRGAKLAEELNHPGMQYKFYHYLGQVLFFPLDLYDQSLQYLHQADALAQELNQPIDRALTMSQIAEVYTELGDYDRAIKYQYEALEIGKEQQDTLTLATGNRIMGVLNYSQKKYDAALRRFKISNDYYEYLYDKPYELPRESKRIAIKLYTSIACIGFAFVGLNKLDSALLYVNKSRILADSISYVYGSAYSEGLIGKIYKDEGEFSKAVDHFQHAYEIFQANGPKREWVSSGIQLAEAYIQMGHSSGAFKLVEDIEGDAAALNIPHLIRDLYKVKSEAYEQLGEVDLAFNHYKRYVQIKDSLIDQKKMAMLHRVEQEQHDQRTQAQITTLQEENLTYRKKIYIYGFGTGCIFLMALLYLVYNRNKTLREVNVLLAQKNEEIQLQNERLTSSNDDLRQFAHVTSHDLREPLRSIGSFATLLKRRYYGKLDDDADEFIDFITKGVERMDALLADLLAYSVVGIFQHSFADVDTKQVVTKIIQIRTREKSMHGARIQMSELPTLTANSTQVTQLFDHLIDNAIKFRSDDPPVIQINAHQQGEEYLFSVKDNGIGMDKAYEEKIFGLFLRLHNRKSKYKGTGIGLSICKKIVEQHKGRIWINSTLGEGTTVYFTLPKNPIMEPAEKQLV